jgi:hypothetical protein
MLTSTASVPTANGSKYLKQLCKHWSHKLKVEMEENSGTVRFSDTVVKMVAGDAGLIVAVEADDAETLERIKGVVASHLDRFAFREAPLDFRWS